MNTSAPVQERRLNMRLMGYWQEQRGTASCAAADDFDPSNIADVWDHCFSLTPGGSPADTLFHHIGGLLAKESDLPVACKSSADVPGDSLLAQVLMRITAFKGGLQPIVDSGNFTDGAGQACLYRGILLPFVGPSGELALVVGGARAKLVSEP